MCGCGSSVCFVCGVWCCGSCLHARVILDGATGQPTELRDVQDVPSVLGVGWDS